MKILSGSNIHQEFQISQLPLQLIKGLLMGILVVMLAISFAALVFSEELAGYIATGIGFVLVGNTIQITLTALFSSYPGFVALSQDVPAVILSLGVVAILARLPALSTPQDQLATVIVAVVATTISTGVFFLVLGRFKLGDLVRFLPYPVVGGYLAGTGWLLFIGGLSLMSGSRAIRELIQPDVLLLWLPGVAFGCALLYIVGRSNNGAVLPLLFFVGLGLFYGVVWLTHTPLATLEARGFLLGSFPQGSLFQLPITFLRAGEVSWQAVFTSLSAFIPIPVVSVIALLLNANAMELVTRRDIRLNRELMLAGISNVLNGFFGGIPGYHALSLSTLNHQLGGGSRLASLVAALFCALMLIFGATLLSFVPRMVVGGVVVYLGLGLLVEWAVKTARRFPLVEYLVIAIILAVIAFFGFLQGILVGTVLTIILFVVSYSRIDVVKHALSGHDFQSRVTRDGQQYATLVAHGDQIFILQLQGFIFFGTANKLLERVRERCLRQGEMGVRFILLDFRQVGGLDSTAMLSFAKMKQLAINHGFVLLLTGLSSTLGRQFDRGDVIDPSGVVRILPSLDQGLEWCENEVLSRLSVSTQEHSLQAYLERLVHEPGLVEDLIPYLHHQLVDQGAVLIRQGDSPDRLFFIESGQVTARLEIEGEHPLRLETMRGGRVVGELGFYLATPRTASVIADEPSSIFSLSAGDLQTLERSNPRLAAAFHRMIASLLAERAVHLMHTVEALNR